MNSFTLSEIQEIEKKFGSYQYLLTFRYANLCVKADAMALLPVTVAVGASGMNIEEVAEVAEMDDYHLGVVPKNQDMLRDIEQAILYVHPEFKISHEEMEKGEASSTFLLCEMPEVDQDRRDVLTEATKSLHDECKARIDSVLIEEKNGFAELMADDPEGLKEAADQLNEKHKNALNDIRDLRDKKLEEIEAAYEKYLSEHAQPSQPAAESTDVTTSYHLGQEE
ncbi:MAG: ribosome recycling factor [Prevotella sp.]|nr:ribosome recycling factor [Prevotella sp.]MBR1502285.1 ribosome recycling factor [Prevotella sp.]